MILKILRRRTTQWRGVEFCESCGEVCTSNCRAEARRERTRVGAAYQSPYLG